jgi:hypothetical protein
MHEKICVQQSTNSTIRDHAYIYPILIRAEAEAAFTGTQTTVYPQTVLNYHQRQHYKQRTSEQSVTSGIKTTTSAGQN